MFCLDGDEMWMNEKFCKNEVFRIYIVEDEWRRVCTVYRRYIRGSREGKRKKQVEEEKDHYFFDSFTYIARVCCIAQITDHSKRDKFTIAHLCFIICVRAVWDGGDSKKKCVYIYFAHLEAFLCKVYTE